MTQGVPLDRSVPALLLRTEPNPLHHGTLAVLRSLGRAGVPVHVVSPERWAPAQASRHRSSLTRWDPAGDPVAQLRAAAGPLGRPVAVAVDDLGALLLARHREALEDVLRLPDVDPGLPAALADKAGLAGLCAQHGVPTAAGGVVPAGADPAAVLDLLPEGPLVVKVSRPWEHPGIGSGRVQRADSRAAARALVAALGAEVLVQELLPPVPGGDAVVVGHASADGRTDLSVAAVKLRTSPPGTGQACLTVAGEDHALAATALAAVRAFGLLGAFDTDWRRDRRDGRWLLLDVNPRLGASFRVGQRADGVDAARALHLGLTGRALPPAPGRPGLRLLVEPSLARTARHYAGSGGLRGPRELAWCSLADPLPALAAVAHVLRGDRPAQAPRATSTSAR